MSTRVISRRVFCIASVAYPSLARADLYDDYINSTSKYPFVSFLGRKGSSDSIGHAFVGAGIQIDSGLRVYERFFGLYPKDGSLAAIKSIFSKVSGQLDQTWADLTWDTEMQVPILDIQKTLVMAKFEEWTDSAPKYSLIANGGMNCSGLVAQVAGLVGQIVPAGTGTTRPWKYIEALKNAN